MKLTESKLRQTIRKTIKEAGFGPQPNQGGGNYFGSDISSSGSGVKGFAKFSSKEAKTIMDKEVVKYSKILKKASYSILKEIIQLVKNGTVDYFDVMRSVSSGNVSRMDQHESVFLNSLLHKESVKTKFKSLLKGKKSLPTRKWK